jgi:dipeptidyl aminopeptidase/acylaminoacyl peptidase
MENTTSKQKISYETLWKAIIRPPRDIYSISTLGPKTFRLKSREYERKDFTLLSNRGYLLHCSLIEPTPSYRPYKTMPLVIYLHANSSSRLEGILMKNYLLLKNINLLIFDFAGSGISEGEYISLGYHEVNDLKIIINYIEKYPGIGNIGLWGRSMGAATTLMYAANDKRIKCICVDSPFADFKRLAKEMCLNIIKLPNFLLNGALAVLAKTCKNKNNFDIYKLKPIDFVKNSVSPALFIHALNDEIVPIQHSLDLVEAYNGEKIFQICEGGHNTNRPQFLLVEVSNFFERYLGKGEG